MAAQRYNNNNNNTQQYRTVAFLFPNSILAETFILAETSLLWKRASRPQFTYYLSYFFFLFFYNRERAAGNMDITVRYCCCGGVLWWWLCNYLIDIAPSIPDNRPHGTTFTDWTV